MRARYLTAIVAIAILALSAKLMLFPSKNAAAISPQVALDIQQMHKGKNVQTIPAQDMSDMSLGP